MDRSYGVGLTRTLRAAGIDVVEEDRSKVEIPRMLKRYIARRSTGRHLPTADSAPSGGLAR